LVTNLPEKAKAQWNRVVEAKTPEEKLRELVIFQSMVPRHKGTEKLLKQVKRKMAQLKEEMEEERKRKKGGFVSKWALPRQGAARLSLLGFSWEMLSKVFQHLTGIDRSGLISYEPIYGIWEWEGVQFQAVLLPPLGGGGQADESVISFSKNSDLLLYVSSDKDCLDLQAFIELLEDHNISIQPPRGRVEVERSASGGVRVIGRLIEGTIQEAIDLLRSYSIYNAIVKIDGEATLEDLEKSILGISLYKPTMILGWKDNHLFFRDPSQESLGEALSPGELASKILDRLSLIRVYTKPAGRETAEKPILLKKGSTVGDLADEVHSWFVKHFKYALLWRRGMEGSLKVSKNYPLTDGDIVELRAL
jgi:ribosome-interacting GTPase 1